MDRYGPSHRRTSNASAALGIFVHHPKKTFATISATSGHRLGPAECLLRGHERNDISPSTSGDNMADETLGLLGDTNDNPRFARRGKIDTCEIDSRCFGQPLVLRGLAV